jgi:hypothetical protein
MNKENSPILAKILQGHKFRVRKPHLTEYYHQVEGLDAPFKTLYCYESVSGKRHLVEGTIDDLECDGFILAVKAHVMCKTATIYFDCSYDLELVDE